MGETMGYGEMLQNLMSRNVVKPGGLFIAEMTSAQAADRSAGWELVRERTYGKTRLAIWKRDEGENEK
jgi:16S rRNA G966 N2-methylase RsmD